MKKYNTIWLLLLALCSIFAGCKKDNTNSATQQDILPPATQTGANTFGCLVNGKVWIPKGYEGTGRSNPHIIYSTGLNGLPYLQISTNNYNNQTSEGYVIINLADLTNQGQYSYPKFNFSIGWSKVIGNCFTQAIDTIIQKRAEAVITKLDIPNRIISGNFNFKFKASQCDTVFVTDGRFDIKF